VPLIENYEWFTSSAGRPFLTMGAASVLSFIITGRLCAPLVDHGTAMGRRTDDSKPFLRSLFIIAHSSL